MVFKWNRRSVPVLPQQKAFSLYFLSSTNAASVQNLRKVANTPFPMSRCQLSKTAELSREQFLLCLKAPARTWQNWNYSKAKTSQPMELLNKHNTEAHNLSRLRKPSAGTLGWTLPHAFSSCRGTRVHGLENCFEFFNGVLLAAGNARGAQGVALYIG